MIEKTVDIKSGHVVSKQVDSKVVLSGNVEDNSNYIEGLVLTIVSNDNQDIQPLKIDEGGYDFSLFLGDFNGDGLEEILVVGQSGGSGGYAIASIYKVKDEKIIEIFNLDQYLASNNCTGEYLEGFLMKVVCNEAMVDYIIYLGNNDRSQLKSIYDKNGKVITKDTPSVSYVNAVNPIYNTITNSLNINLLQRIIGNSNSDTLAMLQTEVSLKDDNINVLKRYVLNLSNDIEQVLSSTEKFRSLIGQDIKILKINENNIDNDIIIRDLNNDGKDEMLIAYKNGDNQYLALARDNKGSMEILDVIQGEGEGIKDLLITPLKQKGKDSIIVGWQLNNTWSILDVYEINGSKFVRQNNNEKPKYTKLEVRSFENKKGAITDLILWCHDTGEAYDVKMLTFKGDSLIIDRKNEKEYFKEVEDYYIKLIDRTREVPQYLYYLADAQHRVGKKSDALKTIEKIMDTKRPYPSVEAVKRLRKRINQ